MSSVISPTVGRRLWLRFRSVEAAAAIGLKILGTDQACDAGVTYVWNDRMVNVLAADHYGKTIALTSVTLHQEGDGSTSEQFWLEWMPYQAQQAKKDAAADASHGDTALEVPAG